MAVTLKDLYTPTVKAALEALVKARGAGGLTVRLKPWLVLMVPLAAVIVNE